MIPDPLVQRLAWHDVTCPEGSGCRSRNLHSLSSLVLPVLDRYHERLAEMDWTAYDAPAAVEDDHDGDLGYTRSIHHGETLTDLLCQRATGAGRPMQAHGAHRWEDTPDQAELAKAAGVAMGPFWCEGLVAHPETMAGGGGAVRRPGPVLED